METRPCEQYQGSHFFETIIAPGNLIGLNCPAFARHEMNRGDTILGGLMKTEVVEDDVLYRHFAEERANKRTEDMLVGMLGFLVMAIAALIAMCILEFCGTAHAFTTEASYYTVESTRREGTGNGIGLMANGEVLNDKSLVCASWDYAFGTKLKLTYKGRTVVAVVSDRGPSKRLYKRGRKIDLSAGAFKALTGGDLSIGILKGVNVEEI